MAKWNEYTTKSAVEDTDELMIADATANVNKRTPLSILWNWIVGKLASAVISQLETNSKSVVGALNELNSNVKYEGRFTLEPLVEVSFPSKIKHDYLLIFKYIDKSNITNIRTCILCSKQREGTEGLASWIAEKIDTVDISISTESCTVISKNTWFSLSIYEL